MSFIPSSALIVTLSSAGIVSDATGGIDYGATAPAGATGQEVAINAALASAFATATALNIPGIKIIWDVAVALGAPVYLYSGMTIEAPNLGCGAIVRANAQCNIFRVHGTETAPASNTSVASQNSFGKQDPVFASDPRYRVFDKAFVWGKNVKVDGGTWNGNSQQQPIVAAGNNQYTTPMGFINIFTFWGVDGLVVRGARFFQAVAYMAHVANCRNALFMDCEFDTQVGQQGTAGVQFDGPCVNPRVVNCRVHSDDDHIAFNADDGADEAHTSGALTHGINWVCGGDISNPVVDGLELTSGNENTNGYGCVRLLSTAHRIDGAMLRNIRGQASRWAVLIETFGTPLISGSGNIGSVVIDACAFDLATGTGTSGVAPIQCNMPIELLEIRNFIRRGAQNFPLFVAETGCVIHELIVSGVDCYEPSANNTVPVVDARGGTIDNVLITGRSTRAAGIGTGASPFLKVSGGAVGVATLRVDGQGITNLIDVQTGSLATAFLGGSTHRLAGGGSPINVAAGRTVANVFASGMMYDSTHVTLASGTGVITNSGSYIEAVTFKNLTMVSAGYDVATAKFGTGALNAGYGYPAAPFITTLPFTVEIWFKVAAAPAALQVIMGQSSLFYIAMNTTGNIVFNHGGTGGTILNFVSAGTYANGAWHHVALSVQTAGAYCAMDGAILNTFSSGQVAAAGPIFTVSGAETAAGTGYIAFRSHGGEGNTYTFQGTVDEPAVWNLAKYTTTYTVPVAAYTGGETGITGLWHLDSNGNGSV